MTQLERITEFKRIFEAMPGKKVDNIRAIRDILCCKENTVRIYLTGTRVIPELKLKVLKAALDAPASAE